MRAKVSIRTLDPFEKTLTLSFLFRLRVAMPKFVAIFVTGKKSKKSKGEEPKILDIYAREKVFFFFFFKSV